ncbi:hypothetical protein CcaverHIS002_0304340 [Cutaneotrichosporon cavernicola]|nr:hypothetical protein CcaverHIS002_0304340 [Cutaneotrichosporon cavernicola]
MEALASLWATLKAYQGPLVTLALIFGPGLLRRLNALLAPAPPDATTPPRSRILWSILLLHAVYAILLILWPSYDTFTSLDLLAPSDILRPFVLHDLNQPADGWTQVDPLVELFLARLGTVEGIGVGGFGLEFGCGGRSEREGEEVAAYYRVWDCGVCGGGVWGAVLSPTLTTARVIAQLSLTMAYILLPVRPSPADLTQARLTRTLDAAYNTLNLAQAARAAITRSPAMSRSAAEWATIRAKAEDNARSDAAVVGAALDSGQPTPGTWGLDTIITFPI